MSFVHLNVHSEYSLVDGMVRLRPLAEQSVADKQAAVAVTDFCNVHSVIKFYRACLSHGIKPIIGCDLWVENPLQDLNPDRLILLCCNEVGYKNLSKFLSAAYLRGQPGGKVVVAWRELEKHSAGLLALLDDHQGVIANLNLPKNKELIDPLLKKYKSAFGDGLYFQISRVGFRGENQYISRIAKLAIKNDIGLVATNRVAFINADEFYAHEIRVCINEQRTLKDERRSRNFTAQQYLKSGEEMTKLFADLPQAIENSAEIAKRCNLFFDFDKNYLPDYPEAQGRPEQEILRAQASDGLCNRLHADCLDNKKVGAAYRERLNLELGVIEDMGFSGYFLIVADFIRWAKQNDIPVGPGRGSGAGSLVAWATGITELDPLQHDLLFERFLNTERISLPDFDIDFCVDGRDKVIDYVSERYGREQVSQITTFGTMAAKAVVRDVGRVMALPLGLVDAVAKMIPFEPGMTLNKALKGEEILRERYKNDVEVKKLIDNAMQLEGLARNAGTHAAGVVIAPRALTEFTPLYADTKAKQAVTQLDKDDLESIGLVKFDFLGLRTLTIINHATKMINQSLGDGETPVDIAQIPMDDTATFEMIQKGGTTAIFQLESQGMRDIILRLLPDKFDDLTALVALYRPGPLSSGMVEDFINRKHGREEISYLHEALAPILESTYGVILYQEQVMKIAQVLAGYTLGEADLLRAAMGKKKPEVMEQQRATFLKGAKKNGIAAGVANSIFNLVEKFAGYGFNKSHSAAYALIAYQTAWLKTHHPAAFMAATLSAEMHNTDKLIPLMSNCKAQGLSVIRPNVNSSYRKFYKVSERKILYGIGAIKGVGKTASDEIAAERENRGEFKDMFDFCRRFNSRNMVNKSVLEMLVKSGAFDDFGHRAELAANIAQAIQVGEQHRADVKSGQGDVFGGNRDTAPVEKSIQVAEWSEAEKLSGEKESLGLYLSGHPYTPYKSELGKVVTKVSGLDLSTTKTGIFAGLVTAVRAIKTRRGKMAFVTFDNSEHSLEINLFSEQYKKYHALIKKGNVLIAYGDFESNGHRGVKLAARNLADIDEFRQKYLREIKINLERTNISDILHNIKSTLSAQRGGAVDISIKYKNANGISGSLALGDEWRVNPSGELITALINLVGSQRLSFYYDTTTFRVKKTNSFAPRHTN